MGVAPEPTAIITVRVPVSMRNQIEELAKAMGRNRQDLALEALRRYIAVESWQVAQIVKGIRAADADKFATDEEVEAVLNKYSAHERAS